MLDLTRIQQCPVCNSERSRTKFKSTLDEGLTVDQFVGTHRGYAKYFDIDECRDCNHVYMKWRDKHSATVLPQVTDPAYLETQEDRISTFDRLLKLVQKHIPSGRLLDIGSYAGLFLSRAQKHFECTGIEPSHWGCEVARSIAPRAQIIESQVEAWSPELANFDAVTLWDVIEHVEDPLACLKKSAHALKEGGIVAISTHDISAPFARILGPKYPWLMRFHFNHFSPATLSILCKSAGLSTVEVVKFNKPFSLAYLTGQIFGSHRLKKSLMLSKIKMAIPTGDFFVLIAKKTAPTK